MANDQKWDDQTSPDEITRAFEKGDRATVGHLVDALCEDIESSARRIDANVAKNVLSDLRKYIWFDKLKQVAETFSRHARNDVAVLVQLAQAHIELGEITTAVDLLVKLKERAEKAAAVAESTIEKKAREKDLGEVVGLLGRAYKQYYVDARPSQTEPRNHDFDAALRYYGDAYRRSLGDYLWHGINCVALLTHQERIAQGDVLAISDKAAHCAREIIEAIEATPPERRDAWDFANLIEANLALGQTPAAFKATEEYLVKADAFALRGTRRQMLEMWLLDPSHPPGDRILPMMDARLAELGGTAEAFDIDPRMAGVYEKVWGETNYMPLNWLNEALKCARSVARIGPDKYTGDGTGFLFDGGWVSDAWAGKHLLLTNAHVCSNDENVQIQYPFPKGYNELTAAFLGEGGAGEAEELPFADLLWSSPPSELDATLLLLDRVPGGFHPPEKLSLLTPPIRDVTDARLNILGHPKGLDMRISLQDNKLVEAKKDSRFIHYRTPTDPGSSGSPVFDQQWRLVALHHGASSVKKANEGIRIDLIIGEIRKALLPGSGA